MNKILLCFFIIHMQFSFAQEVIINDSLSIEFFENQKNLKEL